MYSYWENKLSYNIISYRWLALEHDRSCQKEPKLLGKMAVHSMHALDPGLTIYYNTGEQTAALSSLGMVHLACL
jgi:hypothetical protein